MNTVTAPCGAAPTPHVVKKTKQMSGNISDISGEIVAGIPDVLREFVVDFSHDGSVIRFKVHRSGGRAAGVLTIPDIQYRAWKTMFPKGLEKGPQSRYQQHRRVFFAVDGLPTDAPTSLTDGGASVFFSGYPSSIPAGEWTSKPAELPVVTYAVLLKVSKSWVFWGLFNVVTLNVKLRHQTAQKIPNSSEKVGYNTQKSWVFFSHCEFFHVVRMSPPVPRAPHRTKQHSTCNITRLKHPLWASGEMFPAA